MVMSFERLDCMDIKQRIEEIYFRAGGDPQDFLTAILNLG